MHFQLEVCDFKKLNALIAETLHYEYKLPFNFFALGLNCNKKLPEPYKIRTGVNNMGWLKSLHDAIKFTPSSFFKQIQNLKNYPNALIGLILFISSAISRFAILNS